MAPEEICSLLTQKFGDAVVDSFMDGGHPYAEIRAERWPEVAMYVRDEPRLRFNLLRCVTSLDLLAENKLAAIYDLMRVAVDGSSNSPDAFVEFAVRVTTDRDDPHIPSVAHIWPAADWHEREAYDLMGIVFDGHPDHRRILCPDDWVGHPLRKDYQFPVEYQGIPCTTEHELLSPRH
jgi:NADH-quinone oxidoreductase subunit C